ncbi:uncharacterized protein LOC118745598 [Rhagoletis pomonella]|uniref:uncharacterized protein LOC118745598 n=1 Tax=Rhagoletis pomonella TaxID=28610 RepID=UPI00177EF0CD|nr:uncharacterized protein LOC118745598 [Rhagoletis pomonella]
MFYTTSAIATSTDICTELETKAIKLRANKKDEPDCTGFKGQQSLTTFNATSRNNNYSKRKFSNRSRNNGTAANNNLNIDQNLVVEAQYGVDCDDGTKSKRLSIKNENFLHAGSADTYSKANIISIAQSHIIDDDADYRHATQLMGTELAEHTMNSSIMDQFFLTSGDSDCSSLEKHLVVAVDGCNSSRQEGNSDHFNIGSADLSTNNKMKKSAGESFGVQRDVQNDNNNVFTEFLLKNDDSGNIPISSSTSGLSESKDGNAVAQRVFNCIESSGDLLDKTANSYEQQIHIPHNLDIDSAYNQGSCLLDSSPSSDEENDYCHPTQQNIQVVNNIGVVVQSILGTTEQQVATAAAMTGDDNHDDYKLTPKYVLQLHTMKQPHDQQQKQQQRQIHQAAVLASQPVTTKMNPDITDDGFYEVDDGSNINDAQRLQGISSLDGVLTLQQQIVEQQGEMQHRRGGKVGDGDNGTAGTPICYSQLKKPLNP